MNYNELIDNISAFLNRADGDDDVTAMIPTFIELAEAEFFPTFVSRYLVKQAGPTSVPTSGEATLPADFVELREEPILVDKDGRDMYALQNKSETDQVNLAWHSKVIGPAEYSIQGLILKISPWDENDDYQYRLRYYAKPTPLSSSVQENEALTNYPALYLYGALEKSAPYLADDARTAVWAREYQKAQTVLFEERIKSQTGAMAASMPP